MQIFSRFTKTNHFGNIEGQISDLGDVFQAISNRNSSNYKISITYGFYL